MMSRYEITMEEYTKIINIEALTMINMAKKEILPAATKYAKQLSETILSQKSVCEDIDTTYESQTLKEVSKQIQEGYRACQALEERQNVCIALRTLKKQHSLYGMKSYRRWMVCVNHAIY